MSTEYVQPVYISLDDSEMLSSVEKSAIELTEKLSFLVNNIIGPEAVGQLDDALLDRLEIRHHIIIIQRMIMANAAARAYPGKYRKLGEA
jgi:hypothetical protein